MLSGGQTGTPLDLTFCSLVEWVTDLRHAKYTRCDLWLKPVGGGKRCDGRSFPPLTAKRSHLRLGGLGERLSSPSGSWRSPAAKRPVVHSGLKIKCLAMMIFNNLVLENVKKATINNNI